MTETADPWSTEAFQQRLQALGRYYHIHHPFHRMMHRGELSRAQIRGWVANRYYYQINIPRKDAGLLANCPDRALRRQWVQRILDHDGYGEREGGIEAWLALGVATGLSREEIEDLRHVLPGVRFAVDAYVDFVRRAPWPEGVCASLTELFAPEIHRQRLSDWPRHYPWIDAGGLAYFRQRLQEAPRDVEHGLAFTLTHFRSRAEQERALDILKFKLDVLWAMADAMYLAYVVGLTPYASVEST
jgi:pyrroloquinoline-quinone synthase